MKKDENRERELLQQIVRGNKIAMKTFYDIYSGYLTAVCSRYVSNKEDIKDVLQESFLNIFKSIHNFKYQGAGSLKAWSTRIVVNESLKHIKEKEKLQFTKLPEWELPDQDDNGDPDFEDIPTPVILKLISSLPTGYRTVFNLYVFEEKSHKEIASILDIAENSSASQLHRAKSLLAKEIELYRLNNKNNERSVAR
ncbi:MAG: RNA polymerase sigma factor [Fermentimonas sp.]|jgi:RNA polymerase sigma-70 factor (ECF subfamily)|nr:RNA polymerase sigma factor [Fermentimonas sp.]MDD4697179.1 RNA polymerase sigma factor [Fermentimonas sp.]